MAYKRKYDDETDRFYDWRSWPIERGTRVLYPRSHGHTVDMCEGYIVDIFKQPERHTEKSGLLVEVRPERTSRYGWTPKKNVVLTVVSNVTAVKV